MAAKLLHWIIN